MFPQLSKAMITSNYSMFSFSNGIICWANIFKIVFELFFKMFLTLALINMIIYNLPSKSFKIKCKQKFRWTCLFIYEAEVPNMSSALSSINLCINKLTWIWLNWISSSSLSAVLWPDKWGISTSTSQFH